MGRVGVVTWGASLLLVALLSSAKATVVWSAPEREIGDYRLVPHAPRYTGGVYPVRYYVVNRGGRRIAALDHLPPGDETAQLRRGHLLFWESRLEAGPTLMRTDLRTGRSTPVYKFHFDSFFVSPSGGHVVLIRGRELWMLDATGRVPRLSSPEPALATFLDPELAAQHALRARSQPYQPLTLFHLLGWSADERDFWMFVGRSEGARFVRLRDDKALLMGELDGGFEAMAHDIESQRGIFNADSGFVFHYSDRPGTNRWGYEYVWLTDLPGKRSVLLGKRAREARPATWSPDGSCSYVTEAGERREAAPAELFR